MSYAVIISEQIQPIATPTEVSLSLDKCELLHKAMFYQRSLEMQQMFLFPPNLWAFQPRAINLYTERI